MSPSQSTKSDPKGDDADHIDANAMATTELPAPPFTDHTALHMDVPPVLLCRNNDDRRNRHARQNRLELQNRHQGKCEHIKCHETT